MFSLKSGHIGCIDSEMTVVWNITFKKRIPNFEIKFCCYFCSWIYVFVSLRRQGYGTKTEGSINPRANMPSIFAPPSYGAIVLCPLEFWTPQSLPSGVLEQCNLCPAMSWKHRCQGQKKQQKNYLKSRIYFYDHFLRKNIFCRTVL